MESLLIVVKKTTQPLIIKQLPKMEEIINRYAPSCNGNYLLPILSETDIVKSRLQYKNESRKFNTQLKKLGEILELPIKLTMYVARHSWATAAQKIYIQTSLLIRMLWEGKVNVRDKFEERIVDWV